MNGWETLLAAVGGMLLGLGYGITIGRRGEESVRVERRQIETEMREVVLPVLIARATELGIDVSGARASDSITETIELAIAIRQRAARGDLPYSDTLDVARTALDDRNTGGTR